MTEKELKKEIRENFIIIIDEEIYEQKIRQYYRVIRIYKNSVLLEKGDFKLIENKFVGSDEKYLITYEKIAKNFVEWFDEVEIVDKLDTYVTEEKLKSLVDSIKYNFVDSIKYNFDELKNYTKKAIKKQEEELEKYRKINETEYGKVRNWNFVLGIGLLILSLTNIIILFL